MNLGISRKKYDPCKMETILSHKEEWPRVEHERIELMDNIVEQRGCTEIEFPLTSTPSAWPILWSIYIYIFHEITRRLRSMNFCARRYFFFFFFFFRGNGTIETELWIKWTSERKWLNEMFDIPLDREAGMFEQSATNLPETEKRILINIGG